jgi:hypothetical protein
MIHATVSFTEVLARLKAHPDDPDVQLAAMAVLGAALSREQREILGHCLKNALTPATTNAAVVIETVQGWGQVNKAQLGELEDALRDIEIGLSRMSRLLGTLCA